MDEDMCRKRSKFPSVALTHTTIDANTVKPHTPHREVTLLGDNLIRNARFCHEMARHLPCWRSRTQMARSVVGLEQGVHTDRAVLGPVL